MDKSTIFISNTGKEISADPLYSLPSDYAFYNRQSKQSKKHKQKKRIKQEKPFVLVKSILIAILLKEQIKISKKVRVKRNRYKMRKYRFMYPICELCNQNTSEHTHHKLLISQGGKEHYANYLAVCVPCHRKLHPELQYFIN